MIKIYKATIFLFLISFSFNVNAHVQHYDKLNRIKFDIYRNNQLIGYHTFIFERDGNKLSVDSKIEFKIKKFGAVLYRYSAEGTEVFEDGLLIKFNSKTKQNKKNKYVNIIKKNNNLVIDGSSYKGNAPLEYELGTWWNHSLVKAKAQISAVSGRIIEQNVEFLGKEKITIGNITYDALHFNFKSSDESLSKSKKLNTHVWYDEKKLNWLKATFNKKGKWEYRLIVIK